jgi:hypothetical protein
LSVPCTLELLGRLDISAASGCVIRGDSLFVIADDTLSLHEYDLDGRPRGRIRLFAGALPEAPPARKAAKPDLEALALLPDGSLLAFGSGSTDRRMRAVHVDRGRAEPIDLAPLYTGLRAEIDELNIEGATVVGDTLVLGQRGNGRRRENALVRLLLASVQEDIARGAIDPDAVVAVTQVALGNLDGVPLSITDLCADRAGRLWLSAVAEDTDDPYLDGACAGSIVTRLDERDRPIDPRRLDPAAKIEGLAEAPDGSFRLVADADDPRRPAPLFRAWLR